MKTSRRYLHRIVIPVVAVAFIAIVGNVAYRSFDGDPEPSHIVETDEPVGPNYFEKIETQPFSQEMVEAEVQRLHRSLSSLATAVNTEAVKDDDEVADLASLKSNVEEEIELLGEADSNNWDERMMAAEEALSQYAAAIGKDAQKQPQG